MTVDQLVPPKFRKNHHKHRNSYHRKPERKLMSRRDELLGVKKDGTEFPVEITLGPLQLAGELFTIAIVRDVSERRHIEQLKEKNKELEQFTYVASHDLQEPLRTVTSFISVLEKELQSDNPKVQNYMRFIREGSERMSSLIKGLLDYSRIGKERHLEETDLNLVIHNIVQDLTARMEEQNAVIQLGDLPKLMVYPTEIRLLFQNLISNALKFQPKDQQPIIEIFSEKTDGHWILGVRDNGIGIRPEHHEKIFQIFQRLNTKQEFEGSGIGLAHSLKIVQLHHGSIRVESTFGAGSTFFVSFPKH